MLAGKRKGSHGAGFISYPGGKLDFFENWEQCCLREVKEECGENFVIKVRPFDDIRQEFFVTNDIMPDCGKHFITIFMVADWVSGEPLNAEPEKCEGWNWYSYNELMSIIREGNAAEWIPISYMERYREKILNF